MHTVVVWKIIVVELVLADPEATAVATQWSVITVWEQSVCGDAMFVREVGETEEYEKLVSFAGFLRRVQGLVKSPGRKESTGPAGGLEEGVMHVYECRPVVLEQAETGWER